MTMYLGRTGYLKEISNVLLLGLTLRLFNTVIFNALEARH